MNSEQYHLRMTEADRILFERARQKVMAENLAQWMRLALRKQAKKDLGIV